MKRLIVTLILSLLGLGCRESRPGATLVEFPGTDPIPLTLTVKSGSGFSCFVLNESARGRVFCRSFGPYDPRLGALVSGYTLYFEDSDSPVTDLQVWDDTICISAQVLERPYLRDAGAALYCMGEATIGMNYIGYQYVIYGGSQFSVTSHGSSDLTFAEIPFLGGESSFTMDVMTNTGGTWNVMLDTSTTVSEIDVDCEQTEGTLTCPSFTVEDL